MADGDGKLAGVWVEISADQSKLDADLAKLPAKMARVAGDAAQAMRAQLAKNKLELSSIMAGKNYGPDSIVLDEDRKRIQPLIAANQELARKIGLIEGAVAKKAAAMGAASTATQQYAASLAAASGKAAQFAAAAGGAGMKSQVLDTSMRSVQKSGYNAGMGFLFLSQAIEDAQYGFGAIVNNIPQIVMGFGGSAGLAAATSLSAVAINTWVRNWDDAKEAFGDVSAFKSASSAIKDIGDQALTAGASLLSLSYTPLSAKDVADHAEAKAEGVKRAAGSAKAAATIEGIGAEGDDDRSRAFKEAVQASGGGKKFLADLASAQSRALGKPADEAAGEKQKQALANVVKQALGGDAGSIKTLGKMLPGFGKAYADVSPETVARKKTEKEQGDELLRQKEKDQDEARRTREKAEHERARDVDSVAEMVAKGKVGDLLLHNPNVNRLTETRATLGNAGVKAENMTDYSHEVQQKAREKLQEEVTRRAVERGETEDQARQGLLADRMKQQQARAKAEGKADQPEGTKSERLSLGGYLDKIQASALNGNDKTQLEIAAAVKKSNEFLAQIAQQKGKSGRAKFG